MPAIQVMIKPASGLCNMRCSYCFYVDEMANRRQASYGIMSEQTLENVIMRILETADSYCSIVFQGGEPTLAGLDFYRKCLELEQKYNTKKVKIDHALQTNGYVLDEEWCSFFAQNHFLVGLSVDGIKATHDACRKDAEGQDTYFHVLHAARLLEEAGADFNVLTVVNGRTAPKIRRIYEQYRKLGFKWQQYIACLDPVLEEQGKQDYSLRAEVYGQFLIDLFDLWEIDLKQGRQPYIRQFENYIGILMGQMPESCEQRGVCSLQNVVEADGSVYPCDFYVLDEWRLGTVGRQSFAEMARGGTAHCFIESSCQVPEACRQCPAYPLCRNGCRRDRLPGPQGAGHNYYCAAYRRFFAERGAELYQAAQMILRMRSGLC